ncbi:MAG: N4-gp56 family major capsid protein [Oscillospiraceae bacterium]|nr:N4-gp56 family major capsid protein [Oscillospiraceae bacterium]
MNTNTTTQESLSAENKTFWDRALIVLAAPELIHDQFAQQRDIPNNNGKTIEFRQFDPLPEITTPLVEGVTPDGQSLTVTSTTATVSQYGGYVTTSDILDMTALDPIVNEATKLIARQAGETLDTITRDIINAGTNVMYAGGAASRAALAYTSDDSNNNLTVLDVKKAVRALKRQDAPTIRGNYVAIIHPDVAFDLKNDPEWLAPKQYVDPENIYNGEIGMLYGVRFIENNRAKMFHGDNLSPSGRNLTLSAAASATKSLSVSETLVAGALVGRKVNIGGTVTTVTANTASALTVADNITAASGATVYPGEGGAGGVDAYSTLFLAENAFGTTKVAGGGLEHIVKPLGSGGSSDPLNQRATVGWKAVKTAKILIQQYIVRVESTATP